MYISVNGKRIEVKQVNHLKGVLLELFDIEFSPLEALKSNMTSLFDLIQLFCEEEGKKATGADKSNLTKQITVIDNQRKYWDRIQNKSAFVKKYYNEILALENLGLLQGFGKSNAFGDFLLGNGETQRLSLKHSN
jgi:hypothetical protein